MKSLNFSYLEKLDHLRLFAAILVVFHHFRGSNINLENFNFNGIESFIKIWLVQGSSGVSLFLVLSAFLFTLILNGGNKRIDYKKFIYNRILRIFPLLIVLIFVVITINRGSSTPIDILRIITLQLNTGNSMTGWGHEFFPTGPIWTIAVEFQFYLLLPFIIHFSSKYGLKYLLLCIVFVISLRLIIVSLNSYDIYYNLYHSIIGRLDQFIVGIIFGVIYVNGYFDKIRNKSAFLLIFISIILLTVDMFINRFVTIKYYVSIFSFLFEAILYGVMIISYLKLDFFRGRLSTILAWLGGLSFSIYLLHLPVGLVVNNLLEIAEPTTIAQSILNNIIRLPFIIGMSIITFYAVEKPFMGLRVKYLKY